MKILPVYILAGIAGLVALFAGLTGTPVWFIKDARTAAIALAAAGFVMCATGAITVFVTKAPFHPLTIAGYAIGSLALLAGLAQLFRWNLPVLSDPKAAMLVMAAAIVMKAVIARFANVLVK